MTDIAAMTDAEIGDALAGEFGYVRDGVWWTLGGFSTWLAGENTVLDWEVLGIVDAEMRRLGYSTKVKTYPTGIVSVLVSPYPHHGNRNLIGGSYKRDGNEPRARCEAALRALRLGGNDANE